MKQKTRNIVLVIIILILLSVFIVAGLSLFIYFENNKKSEETYNNAQQSVEIETLPIINETYQTEESETNTAPTSNVEVLIDPYENLKIDIDVNWVELESQSDDLVGWLYIPDTNINYPLVQRDNQYYLDHDFEGNYNSAGALFLDRYVDMNSKNIIIYGHNMQSDIMFHRLRNYKTQDYADNHKYIYVATKDFIRIYELSAVVYADKSSDVYTWEFDKDGQIKFEDYINNSTKNSIINTSAEITNDDCILSLSTCSGRSKEERLIVQAVLLTEY